MSSEPRDERSLLLALPLAREVTLRYPLSWFTPADDAPVFRTLPAHDERGPGFARFGGWPGAAAPARSAVAVRFLAFWQILGSDLDDADLLTAVRGDDEPGDLSIGARAWWETARRCRAAMGPAWCERLGEHFADWRTASRCEARMASKLVSRSPYPRRDVLLPVRTAAVGVAPALDLLEYVHDCPLPHEVRTHPAFEAVGRYAARLLALQCDLASAPDDLAAGRPNLLLALLRGESLAPADTLAELEALHDESLCGLSGASQWLRAEFSRSAPLARWLRAVQAMCHGFARWHGQGGAAGLRIADLGALTIEIDYV